MQREPTDGTDRTDTEPRLEAALPLDGAKPRRRPGRPSGHTLGGEVETRERVLTEARRLFMQRGFAGVSVGEVAAAVGVTKPTLYYHFGDKEGLYAAVLCDILREVGGYVRRVTENDHPFRQRLFDLAVGYFLYADATMEPMLRDTGELIGAERAAAVWDAYERDFFSPLRTLMREGMRRGELAEREPDMLVHALLGLLDGFTAAGGHTARPRAEHERVAGILVTLFLQGAATRA